ncbi:MAG: thiamine phosphate synthase [Cyanobacteria bacterium J06598_1]
MTSSDIPDAVKSSVERSMATKASNELLANEQSANELPANELPADSSNFSHTKSSLTASQTSSSTFVLTDTSEDQALLRILDANLDRAREGLRTVEEWCRFGLNDQTKTAQIKNLRQTVGHWHTPTIRAARDTPGDLGTTLTHPEETQRASLSDVLQVNLARTQEALRVLEEYGKLYSQPMSAACKQMRYQLYTLDSQLMDPFLSEALLTNAAPSSIAHSSIAHSSERDRLMQKLTQARTYLVTSPVPDILGVVEAALKGGIAIVQYREKTADDETRLHLAQQMRAVCHQYNALFIVNDRVDIAAAAEADGVHLGQQDLPMPAARQILGPNKIIGRSTTSPQELKRALDEGADYIGVGPVHATPTKPGKAASGNEYVRYAAQHATMPWFTIGGLNAANLEPTLAAGATRVAVVRALMEAKDPTAIAQSLVKQTQQSSQ